MTTTEPDANVTEAVTGIPFTLNGQELLANEGEMLIDACERNGVHIPRFCYHPRMKPVGMCRMCLVEVDTGRGPGLQPSCMLTVTPDMKVATDSEPTKSAQDSILELTLINHPLDCPVCDKGGECPLQDNAYAYGPGESRFVEEKRHYEKPIPISDLVYLDRERCILCDRCTRFAKDVAGDPLIHFIDRGAETQVNTFPDHPFSSYFSGNTVQICPVGALTAEPYRFKARPWDLTEIESTAVTDSTGARVVLQSSRDQLVRVLGVDSDAVNWSWLSDKERFSYEATTSPGRVSDPLVRNGDGEFVATRWSDAGAAAAKMLSVGPDRIGVIGGARLTLESQYAWSKLVRGLGASSNIDAQLNDGLPAEVVLGLTGATIGQAAEPGGVVVLLSADPKEELPTLYIRLRHAALEDGVSLIEMTPRATSFGSAVAVGAHPRPGTVAEVAAALADASLDNEIGGVSPEQLAAIHDLLVSGRPVTVVLGRPNLAESSDHVVAAAAALRRLVPEARFLSALRRGNIHGALEMGLTPEFAAGGVPAAQPGLDSAAMFRAAVAGEIDTLVLLGSDPLRDLPDQRLVSAAFDAVPNVVAVDLFLTESSSRADIVLPAAAWGEADGTFLNLEGRLSPLRAKVTAPSQARPDWMIAAELAFALGGDLGFATLDELRADLSGALPAFAAVDWAALSTSDDGPLLDRTRTWEADLVETVAVPPTERYGFRLVVDRKLWDQGTMVQESASLTHLAEPARISVHPDDLAEIGVAAGGVVQVEIDGEQHQTTIDTDAGLARGSARVPFNLAGLDASRLLTVDQSVTDVRVTAG